MRYESVEDFCRGLLLKISAHVTYLCVLYSTYGICDLYVRKAYSRSRNATPSIPVNSVLLVFKSTSNR